MKKVASVSILALFASFAFASSTEDFFYSKGYDNGYNAGYERGVKAGMKEAKNILKRYANELRAYEVGRYLVQSKNLTYPQVYQQQNANGTFSLVVTPSRIEKELNIDALFAKFSTLPEKIVDNEISTELSLNEKNSVYLTSRDNNDNDIPQKSDSTARTQTLEVEKSSKNFDILKRANVVFSDEGNSYNVLFFSEREKTDFCNSFKICN